MNCTTSQYVRAAAAQMIASVATAASGCHFVALRDFAKSLPSLTERLHFSLSASTDAYQLPPDQLSNGTEINRHASYMCSFSSVFGKRT